MPLMARALVFAALAATMIASPAAAQQSVADFYKGKTVALLLGTGPGGSYDLYARIFAEHLHAPHPRQSVDRGRAHAGRGRRHRRQPPVRSRTAGWHQDPASHAIIMSEVLDPKAGVRFSRRSSTGSVPTMPSRTRWRSARGAGEDHRRSQERNIVLGSFAKAHFTYQWAGDGEDVLGLNFKLITGYPTANHNNSAMERGEIHAGRRLWENLIGTRPH